MALGMTPPRCGFGPWPPGLAPPAPSPALEPPSPSDRTMLPHCARCGGQLNALACLRPLAQCSDEASPLRALRRPPQHPYGDTRCRHPVPRPLTPSSAQGPAALAVALHAHPANRSRASAPFWQVPGPSPGPRGRIRRCRQRQQVSAPAALRMGMTGFNSPGQPHTHLGTRSSGGV